MTDKETLRHLATAVLSSDAMCERRLQDSEILKLLVNGEKEIAAGLGHSLDEVLADADDLFDEVML